MEKNNGSAGGVGFTSLLTILFIALKLCGVINWSWVWVISPIWIGTILIVLLVLLAWIFRA